MTRSLPALAAMVLALSACPAQQRVIPSDFAGLPGNAALSMPVRWSQGVMQVIWDEAMIPDEIKGQTITSVRLRRPAFDGEPDYGALSRTVKLSMGMTTLLATQMVDVLELNRPEPLTVVAGPTSLSVPATVVHGRGDAVAATFVTVTLDQPFTVESTGNLFLEWENIDSSLSVSLEHWAEAIELPDAGGMAIPLGTGGCGSLPDPMVLSWVQGPGPASRELTSLLLQAVVPDAPSIVLLSLDPQSMAPPNHGFGADLTGISLPGCYQWTDAFVLALPYQSGAAGTMNIDLPFPRNVNLAGKKVGIQVLTHDPAANPTGAALSNGVILLMDTLDYARQCTTVMLPGVGDRTPFPPLRGVAPLFQFGF